MTTRFVPPVCVASALLSSLLLITACSEKPSTHAPATAPSANGASATPAATASAAPAAAPAISVTLAKATQRDIAVTIKATGTVTSLSTVDVKPQVTSVVTKVNFKEGQFVKRGDLLFTLDSRTDEANLAKAKAQLAKDEATLLDAKRQLARNQELVAKGFIAQSAADTSQSNVEGLTATIAADKAALDAATTALSYNRITAAQAGRVGVINVFPGSAVQANQTTLVTITQLDPIAVAFNLPQSNLSDALSALKGHGTFATAKLPDGSATVKGTLSFIDNVVDAASGTVKMKALFPNKENKLWPGGYADITLSTRTIKDAVVIPRASVIQNARGTIVYVVENGKTILRPIKVLFAQGEDAAVSGIQVGESVVQDGKQNVRPNVAVVERAAKPAAASTPASSASASVPTPTPAPTPATPPATAASAGGKP
ncbi:MAG: efflux RND transporter periplasmic adaptor subunit [Cytophagales bacterium]|nr:efflux RND transporter periplasmic adaptor subunit [Cytophagales bacterium]